MKKRRKNSVGNEGLTLSDSIKSDEQQQDHLLELFDADFLRKSSSRRDFLKVFGFSLASAAVLAGCKRPVQNAIPYIIQPPEITPGRSLYYATSYYDGHEYSGILVKTRDGRPIKIEGNALSTFNREGTTARVQASILSLYDDARLKNPTADHLDVSWDIIDDKIISELARINSKGADIVLADGSTFLTYAADSHYLFGELYFRPAADYPSGALQQVYEWDTGKFLGTIPQVSHTYSVVGNMNEYQVSIGETTYGGREELSDSTALVDYGTLMYTALQRSKTAREAIKVMAELVATYGYYSSGESFSVVDPNEAWIFEMISKGIDMKVDKKSKKSYNANKGAVWVAVRIPDGYISGHANHPRITTFPKENLTTSVSSKNLDKIFSPDVEFIYAYDVIDFARSKGYYNGTDEEFSFSDIYAPLDFGGARFCEARVWSFFKEVNKSMWDYFDYAKGLNLTKRMPLYIKPERKISVHDMMNFMRDHLEGTELDMSKDPGAGPHALPYRWRPMTWKYEGKGYIHERTTATQQTGFSFVSQMRSWLPNPIGGIHWFSVDDAASTVYFPVYCGITSVPEAYAEGKGDMLNYCDDCAFWTFNKVSNFAYLRYDIMHAEVAKVQNELETKFIENTPIIDKAATELYKSDPSKAIQYLTDYSVNVGNFVVQRWEKLFQYLLVKFMDGNVKQEENGKFKYNDYNLCPAHVNNPEFPDWWKKIIIDATGDKLKQPEGAGGH